MKNRLKRIFTTNIGWKIAAVFIGIIIWAVLSNTQDPVVTVPLDIPITYTHEESLLKNESLYVLTRPETVRINARVHQSKSRKATASLFTCTADLVDHSGGDLSSQRIHINVQQIGGTDIVIDWSYYRSDPNITVTMDEYISKEFTVALKAEGNLSADAQFQEPVQFSPSVVTVSGPKSRFANVNSVKATVNLPQLNAKGPGTVTEDAVEVKMYDANDEEIRNTDGSLVMSADTVSLTATIARLRELAVILEGTSGTPAEGYRVDTSLTSLSPTVIVVKGLKGNLSELNTLVIPASLVNVDGISSSTSYEISLAELLPEGVTIAEGASTANVTVNVEALVAEERNYNTSNIQLLNTDELYLYTILENSIPIQVRGFQEDLSVLDINASLQSRIDVSGLEPGTHTVSVQADALSGYYWDNIDRLNVTLRVRINEAMTTTPETEPPTESTTESTPETEESASGSSDESSGDSSSSESTSSEEASQSEGSSSEEPSESAPEDSGPETAAPQETAGIEGNPEENQEQEKQNADEQQ